MTAGQPLPGRAGLSPPPGLESPASVPSTDTRPQFSPFCVLLLHSLLFQHPEIRRLILSCSSALLDKFLAPAPAWNPMGLSFLFCVALLS